MVAVNELSGAAAVPDRDERLAADPALPVQQVFRVVLLFPTPSARIRSFRGHRGQHRGQHRTETTAPGTVPLAGSDTAFVFCPECWRREFGSSGRVRKVPGRMSQPGHVGQPLPPKGRLKSAIASDKYLRRVPTSPSPYSAALEERDLI